MPITDPKIIQAFIDRRIDKVLPGKKELFELLTSGRRLKLYQGFDPTSPNLHIGHLVGLINLKTFQDLGHEVIFLLGDGTGQAGDPSGKTKDRGTFFTKDQLRENAKTYQEQAGMILDFGGDNPIQLKFNSTWLNELKLVDLLNIADKFSVQQIIERDMYQKRIENNESINLREFLYPLLQGYDSVAMEVDIEVGGTDQLFNMGAGRKLVKDMLGKEKFVVTTPLLADSSGRKIGKTEGNAINITNQPQEFYGQIMSLPDDAIFPCFQLITMVPDSDLPELKKLSQNDPMQAKKKLAWNLLEMLQGKEAANAGQSHFENTFQKGQTPDDILEVNVEGNMSACEIVVNSGLAPSNSQFRRLVDQNAVKIDGETISDPNLELSSADSGKTIQVGKRRFLKIK